MCVAYCPLAAVGIADHDVIASGGADGKVALWHAATGELIHSIDHKEPRAAGAPEVEREQVYVCCHNPSFGIHANHLVTAADHAMRHFDLQTQQVACEWGYETHEGSPWVSGGIERNSKKIAFIFDAAVAPNAAQGSPVSDCIVVGLGDGTVRLTDRRAKKEAAIVGAREKWCTGVCFSDDGSTVGSSWGSGAGVVWDTRTWQASGVMRGHEAAAYGCGFWPDQSELMVTWSGDATVKLWDVATQRTVAWQSFDDYPIYHVAFAPDKESMLVVGGPPTNIGGCPGKLLKLSSPDVEAGAGPGKAGGGAAGGEEEPSALSAIMGQ